MRGLLRPSSGGGQAEQTLGSRPSRLTKPPHVDGGQWEFGGEGGGGVAGYCRSRHESGPPKSRCCRPWPLLSSPPLRLPPPPLPSRRCPFALLPCAFSSCALPQPSPAATPPPQAVAALPRPAAAQLQLLGITAALRGISRPS